jgi:hypothetical protein
MVPFSMDIFVPALLETFLALCSTVIECLLLFEAKIFMQYIIADYYLHDCFLS